MSRSLFAIILLLTVTNVNADHVNILSTEVAGLDDTHTTQNGGYQVRGDDIVYVTDTYQSLPQGHPDIPQSAQQTGNIYDSTGIIDNIFDEQPIIEQPSIIEEVIIEDPIIQEPIIEEPVIETPIIEEPVIETPIIEEPIIEAPIIEEPVIEEPNTIYEDIVVPNIKEHTEIDIIKQDTTNNVVKQELPQINNNTPVENKTANDEYIPNELETVEVRTETNLVLLSVTDKSQQETFSDLKSEIIIEEEEFEDNKNAFRDLVGADLIVKRIIKLKQLQIEINKLKERLQYEKSNG